MVLASQEGCGASTVIGSTMWCKGISEVLYIIGLLGLLCTLGARSYVLASVALDEVLSGGAGRGLLRTTWDCWRICCHMVDYFHSRRVRYVSFVRFVGLWSVQVIHATTRPAQRICGGLLVFGFLLPRGTICVIP